MNFIVKEKENSKPIVSRNQDFAKACERYNPWDS